MYTFAPQISLLKATLIAFQRPCIPLSQSYETMHDRNYGNAYIYCTYMNPCWVHGGIQAGAKGPMIARCLMTFSQLSGKSGFGTISSWMTKSPCAECAHCDHRTANLPPRWRPSPNHLAHAVGATCDRRTASAERSCSPALVFQDASTANLSRTAFCGCG